MYKRKPIENKIAKAQHVMSLSFVVSDFFLQFAIDQTSNWLKNIEHPINIPEIIPSVQFYVK